MNDDKKPIVLRKRAVVGEAVKLEMLEEPSEITPLVSSEELEKVRNQIKSVLEIFVSSIIPGVSFEVSYFCGPRTTVYKIDIPAEVRGRIIGSQGKTICSLRQILAAMSGAYRFRAIIDLIV